jgi:hypothetical protein
MMAKLGEKQGEVLVDETKWKALRRGDVLE